MKYANDLYLSVNIFEGDESEIALHTSKIVKSRKPHICTFNGEPHAIFHGDKCRVDRALIDSDIFATFYSCESCLNQYIEDYGLNEEEES